MPTKMAPCSPAIARAPWGELEGDLLSAGFGQEGSEMSLFFFKLEDVNTK